MKEENNNLELPEDLFYGYFGNGLTVCDRNRNYSNVAHISDDYTILTLYGLKLSELAIHNIQRQVLTELRKKHKEYPEWTYEQIPVIVKNQFKPNHFKYEVQVWTPEMIDLRVNNKGGVTYDYVELLHYIEYGEGENRVWLRDWVNYFGDKFSVDTEDQPDYFKTFSCALDSFKDMIPLDYKS